MKTIYKLFISLIENIVESALRLSVSSTSSSSQPFMPFLADDLHNSRHALRSWATLVRWLLPTSSMLFLHLPLGILLLIFNLCVYILVLSWPTWCCSFWLHVQPTVLSCTALSLLYLIWLSRHWAWLRRGYRRNRSLIDWLISLNPVLDQLTWFQIVSLFMMFINNLPILRWVTVSFFSDVLLEFISLIDRS